MGLFAKYSHIPCRCQNGGGFLIDSNVFCALIGRGGEKITVLDPRQERDNLCEAPLVMAFVAPIKNVNLVLL